MRDPVEAGHRYNARTLTDGIAYARVDARDQEHLERPIS